MTLRSYLIIMGIATLICWSVFLFVVWTVNPLETNLIGFSLFYISLFLSLIGTSAIVGFLFRFVGKKKAIAFYFVKEAFRQSFLFSFFVVAVLLLLANRLFSWINLFLLMVALSALEFFLISYRRSYPIYKNENNLENNI